MKPRKPRVLWCVISGDTGDVIWNGTDRAEALDTNAMFSKLGCELVRFVEGPRRKRSPRGRKPSHEEHVKAHKALLKARKAARRKA